MSYALLYEAWKREKESHELQSLDREFYSKLSQYVKSQREELQMLDEKTLKASLLSEEHGRVKKLLSDLILSRRRSELQWNLVNVETPGRRFEGRSQREKPCCHGRKACGESKKNISAVPKSHTRDNRA
jgi:hypothetical protein